MSPYRTSQAALVALALAVGPDAAAEDAPPTGAGAPSPEAEAQRERDDWYDLPPLAWVGFGIGTAFLVTGTVTGIATLNRADTIEERCKTRCFQSEIDADEPRAHLSTASFVIAAVAIGGGVTAVLLDDDEAEEPAAAASVRPVVGLGGAGIEGSF